MSTKSKRKFLTAVSGLAAALTSAASLAGSFPAPDQSVANSIDLTAPMEFVIGPAIQSGDSMASHQYHQSHRSHSSHSSHRSHQSHSSHISGS